MDFLYIEKKKKGRKPKAKIRAPNPKSTLAPCRCIILNNPASPTMIADATPKVTFSLTEIVLESVTLYLSIAKSGMKMRSKDKNPIMNRMFA